MEMTVAKQLVLEEGFGPKLGDGFILFIFTPRIGEDEPILTHIFQTGWSHQLVKIWVRTPVLQKPIFESTGEKNQKIHS